MPESAGESGIVTANAYSNIGGTVTETLSGGQTRAIAGYLGREASVTVAAAVSKPVIFKAIHKQ